MHGCPSDGLAFIREKGKSCMLCFYLRVEHKLLKSRIFLWGYIRDGGVKI